jgi:hypothetical protein
VTHQDIPRRRGSTNHAYAAQHAQVLADTLTPSNDIPLTLIAGATAQGDPRKLRGIPCIARGVGGTSPGTNPEARATRRH